MNWFIHSLKNYANFSGRANRREWWIFWFFCCTPAALVAVGVPNLAELDWAKPLVSNLVIPILVLVFLWNLVLLIPLLAVTIRRFHDIGLSGWWWLFTLVPILGGIFLLLCTLIRGNQEANAYGPPPSGRPQMPLKKAETLSEQISVDLEQEQQADELLTQLQSLLESNFSPDELQPDDRNLLLNFYEHWFSLQAVTKRSDKYTNIAVGLILVFVSSLAILLLNFLCRVFFEWPFLTDPIYEVLSSVLSLSLVVFVLILFLSSPPISVRTKGDAWARAAFARRERKAKTKFRATLEKHRRSASVSKLFSREIYPELRDAFTTVARLNSDNMMCLRLAALEVVKERTRDKEPQGG